MGPHPAPAAGYGPMAVRWGSQRTACQRAADLLPRTFLGAIFSSTQVSDRPGNIRSCNGRPALAGKNQSGSDIVETCCGCLLLIAIGAILFVSCGSGDDDEQSELPAARASATAAPTPTPQWHLDDEEIYDPPKGTVWVDMATKDPELLFLLDGAEATDAAGTIATDDLDDDEGLTSVDVEIRLLTEPEHGTLELNPADGTATYTPESEEFQGEDKFSYTIQLKGHPETIRRTQHLVLEWSPGERSRRTFDNCADARAHGAAPVHEGDPGWGSHLDADGDGIGCEWS